ncbi:hypothetical protein E3O55_08525 [Cryobacterium sp. MDB1-18-2]|uniref:hypothetical protein n=1 Tax=unclassified Cryobacterium TaxID=2649013 RepID=UPI00106B0F65|nr:MULTISPECIES: hypothetical protein [unclassified Cryobacterium]TFC30118.1 hypothetical protein E3O55_08525 [Cryobacterium sp. MDB1-18-2]TFC41398.1 hypothetical protein E3O50_09965 [Cryobacterium sp. MDB1-18-1]
MARTGNTTRNPAMGTYSGSATFAADLTDLSQSVAGIVGEEVGVFSDLPLDGAMIGRSIYVRAAKRSFNWTGTTWAPEVLLYSGTAIVTTAPMMQVFEVVVNLAADGKIGIDFPVVFPGACLFASGINVDIASRPVLNFSTVSTAPNSAFFQGTIGAAFAGGGMARIRVFALGY